MISCALVYQIGAGPIVSSASEALRVLKFEGSARYNVHDYIRKHFGDFHTMDERLVFDDIDAYIARQWA